MSPSGDRLVVACAADAAYALPLTVTLRSALEHLAEPSHLEIHAVDDGLSAGDRRRLEQGLGERARVHWHRPRRLGAGALPTWNRMPTTTYQKLALGEWLPPGETRALWLDGDLLVLRDLKRLWTSSLDGAVLGAVVDELVPTLGARFGVGGHRDLGLPATAGYFNAGVLLVDLERWRAESVTARALDYVARRGRRIYLWDQEALNATLHRRWRPLDPRWNSNAILAALREKNRGQPAPEPWIVHYCGRLKPWRLDGLDRHQPAYFDCLDRTPWAGFRPPSSRVRRLIARYATSGLRRRLFGAEQTAVALRHTLSRLKPFG